MTKKERERWFAERFVRFCRPDLKLDPQSFESPDFLATDATGRAVGLEVTMLVEEDQLQTDAFAARIERLLQEKRLTRLAANPTSVLGTVRIVGFPREHGKSEGFWPPVQQHDALCASLLDLVESRATGSDEDIDIKPSDPADLQIFKFLMVHKDSTRSMAWDLWPRARFVGFSPQLLTQRVQDKLERAKRYDATRYQLLYLLIVVGLWQAGETSESASQMLEVAVGKSAAPFDEVYLTDLSGTPNPLLARWPLLSPP